MQGLAGAYSGMQGLAARRGFVQAASMPAVTWDSSIVVNCPSLSHSAVSPGVWLQGLSQSAPCHSLFFLVDQRRHCSVNAAVGVLLAPLELGCSFASTSLHCPLVSCRVCWCIQPWSDSGSVVLSTKCSSRLRHRVTHAHALHCHLRRLGAVVCVTAWSMHDSCIAVPSGHSGASLAPAWQGRSVGACFCLLDLQFRCSWQDGPVEGWHFTQ